MRFVGDLLHRIGVQNPEHALILVGHRWRRWLSRYDETLRATYFKAASEPRLHIGSGWHRLPGWLNCDISLVPGVMWLDATRRFPFADGTFRYLFTEHMIEHLSNDEGIAMLRECNRVLKPDGIIRIVTPDLSSIIRLYSPALSKEESRYISYFGHTFLGDEAPSGTQVVNAFFRMWGQQFLYDEATLTEALQVSGFSSIRRHRLGDSEIPALQGLENESRYPQGLLDFESVALEAKKEDCLFEQFS